MDETRVLTLTFQLGACSAGEIARHLGARPAEVTACLHRAASLGQVKVYGHPLNNFGVYWVHRGRLVSGKNPHYWNLRRTSREEHPALWQGGVAGQGKTRVVESKWTDSDRAVFGALKAMGGQGRARDILMEVDLHPNSVSKSLKRLERHGIVGSEVMRERGQPLLWHLNGSKIVKALREKAKGRVTHADDD